MKPSDFRNANWEAVRGSLRGLRERVFIAWQKYGPGTTEQVAHRAAISILTFRPRTTELFQMGLVELSDLQDPRGHEGRYQAVSREDWEKRLEERRRAGVPVQTVFL